MRGKVVSKRTSAVREKAVVSSFGSFHPNSRFVVFPWPIQTSTALKKKKKKPNLLCSKRLLRYLLLPFLNLHRTSPTEQPLVFSFPTLSLDLDQTGRFLLSVNHPQSASRLASPPLHSVQWLLSRTRQSMALRASSASWSRGWFNWKGDYFTEAALHNQSPSQTLCG